MRISIQSSYELYLEEMGVPKLTIEQKREKRKEKKEETKSEIKVVDKWTYMRIINGLFKYMFKLVIEGHDVKLANKLGNIGIRGVKESPRIDEETGEIKGLTPNWGATKKYRAANPEAQERKDIIYCTNEHSNGIRYRFYWYTKMSYVINISFYTLKLCKANKRAINKAIKEGRDYLLLIKKEKKDGKVRQPS